MRLRVGHRAPSDSRALHASNDLKRQDLEQEARPSILIKLPDRERDAAAATGESSEALLAVTQSDDRRP